MKHLNLTQWNGEIWCIDELTAQVAWLNRQLFGRKSEKLAKYDPNQPTLFEDEFLASAAEIQQARDEAVATITQSARLLLCFL